ncbi:MAG TPA: hypothetical protein VMZ73_07190 [Acidimicrobiales bacterium]|nr:hypothetical protein [Acidimicrobiales bacterium]
MGLMDKARQTAEQARAGMMGERPVGDVDPDAPPPPPPSARAGAAVNAFIERINPGLLADLIIHATAAQEKTNKALRDKGSLYRISEMYLTASIPPQVGFYIARLGDAEQEAADLAAGDVPPAPATKKAPAAAAKKRAPRPAGP